MSAFLSFCLLCWLLLGNHPKGSEKVVVPLQMLAIYALGGWLALAAVGILTGFVLLLQRGCRRTCK